MTHRKIPVEHCLALIEECPTDLFTIKIGDSDFVTLPGTKMKGFLLPSDVDITYFKRF